MIAKRTRPGKAAPLRAFHDGKWMTAKEIAPLVGLATRTVRERISKGLPVHRISRDYYGGLHHYAGEMRGADEIAEMIGATRGLVHYRIKHGIPLDKPVMRKPAAGAIRAVDRSLLESGERKIAAGAGENGLYWEDDLEARVWHMYCGGDAFGECTLDEIAQLWDVTRERIRQIEHGAIAKIRARAERGDPDALALQELLVERIAMREARGPSVWDQAELIAPWTDRPVRLGAHALDVGSCQAQRSRARC